MTLDKASFIHAHDFYSNEKTARQLFFGSLIHISLLMALMMVHKTYDTSMSHSLLLDDDEDDEEYAHEEEQSVSL